MYCLIVGLSVLKTHDIRSAFSYIENNYNRNKELFRNPPVSLPFPGATDNRYRCIKVAIDDSDYEKEKDRKVERHWTVSISS